MAITTIALRYGCLLDDPRVVRHSSSMKRSPIFRILCLGTLLCALISIVEARQDPFAVRPRLYRPEEPLRSADDEAPAGLPEGESLFEFRRALGRIHGQINEGRLERALSMVESARITYGNMPDLLYLGVRAAMMSSEWNRADQLLSKLVHAPANELQQFDYLSRWGLVLIQLREFDRAEKVMRQVLDLQPYEASNVYLLMIALIATDASDEAQILPQRLRFTDFAEVGSHVNEDHVHLLELLGSAGYWQLAAAIVAGGEVSHLKPVPIAASSTDNWDNMLLLTNGDSSLSFPDSGIPVGEIQRQVRILERFILQYNQMIERGYFGAAAELVDKLLERHRALRTPTIEAAGAVARFRDGNNDALKDLRDIVERYPLNAAAALFYIESLLETGQFEQATAAAQTFNQHYPKHSLGLLYLASAYAGNNQIVDAQSVLGALPMILQPLVVHWLSTPRPYFATLLQDAHFESWRHEYLRMGRD